MEKVFIFVCSLSVPLIMLFFGIIFRKHGPKKINGIYGYRTEMSMKNKETWEFAHRYCGVLWIRLGFIMLIVSTIITLISFRYDDNIQGIIVLILMTIQTIILIISIFLVEKELKKNFDKSGNRIN